MAAERQPFLGFGAQVWLGQEALEPAFSELGIRWVRLGIPGTSECDVEEGGLPDLRGYAPHAMPQEPLVAMGAMLKRQRAEVILASYGVPEAWLDAERRLPAERLETYAQRCAGLVDYVVKSGIRPRYLELPNEANGTWGGGCRPEDYNRLVKRVRRELDHLGHNDVEICGPGPAQVTLQGTHRWIEALDAEGGAALGAWSLHGLEEHRAASAAAFREEFRNGFLAPVARKKGAGKKPVLITRYGTSCDSFHGRTYVSPRDAYLEQTAAQAPAWCARVVENGLSLLNEGAHALLYWQLSDTPWEETNFGAYTRLEDGAQPQMIHHALKGFYPEVTDGFHVVETTQDANVGVYAAALRNGSRVVCCLVNRTEEPLATDVRLVNYGSATLVRRHVFEHGRTALVEPGTPVKETISVAVPGDGFVTLVLDSSEVKVTGESTVHVDQPLHPIDGFGASAWIGDPGALAVMDELGMNWVRLNMEGIRQFDQYELTAAGYVGYFHRVTEWDRIQYLWAIKEAVGLRFMVVSYGAPQMWCGESKALKAEHAEDLARLWAAGIKAYADRGFAPDYVELFNEPDGNWDTYCAPDIYKEVVKAAREELDRYGLKEIKIAGPGLAHIDVGDSDEWVEALDEHALEALGAFSIHGWTWHGPGSHSSEYVRKSSRRFMESVNARDPERKRLRMLTEFLAKDFVIDGVEHGDHAKGFTDTAVDTVPFAVHVTEDLLSHLNAGFNTVMVWQMADQWWGASGWGLMGRMEDGYPRKPIFDSLKILLPELSPGFRTLKTENASGAYVAAFLRDDRVVMAVVNASRQRQVQRIRLTGVDQAVVFRLKRFDGTGVSGELPRETVRDEWLAELPAVSVTVAVLKLTR